MSQTNTVPGEDSIEVPKLDEREFLRRFKRRSMVRSVVTSALVVASVMVVAGAGLLGWQLRLNSEANRILFYYPELAKVSRPNAYVVGTGPRTRQFPGATDHYLVARMLGTRPVPADDVRIDYDVWGGEQIGQRDRETSLSTTRRYEGTRLVPMLTFLHPALLARFRGGEDLDYNAELVRGYLAETVSSLERLAALPPSSTVEVALSFSSVKSPAQVAAFVGDRGLLSWAPIDLWGPSGPRDDPNAYDMLGLPYALLVGSDSGGHRSVAVDDFDPVTPMVDSLESIQRYAPKGVARRAAQSRDYIKKNGVSHYGAVVVGPAVTVLKLATRDEVTAVSAGLVLLPGE